MAQHDEPESYKASIESDGPVAIHERGEEKQERPLSLSERRRGSSPTKDDPFGDEEGAVVRYQTLRWWYVDSK